MNNETTSTYTGHTFCRRCGDEISPYRYLCDVCRRMEDRRVEIHPILTALNPAMPTIPTSTINFEICEHPRWEIEKIELLPTGEGTNMEEYAYLIDRKSGNVKKVRMIPHT